MLERYYTVEIYPGPSPAISSSVILCYGLSFVFFSPWLTCKHNVSHLFYPPCFFLPSAPTQNCAISTIFIHLIILSVLYLKFLGWALYMKGNGGTVTIRFSSYYFNFAINHHVTLVMLSDLALFQLPHLYDANDNRASHAC